MEPRPPSYNDNFICWPNSLSSLTPNTITTNTIKLEKKIKDEGEEDEHAACAR